MQRLRRLMDQMFPAHFHLLLCCFVLFHSLYLSLLDGFQFRRRAPPAALSKSPFAQLSRESYNVKILGVPERLQDESAVSINKLCLNIFKETGAEVSMYEIDTVQRVPSRNNNGQPKPIVCRFVRRLAKEGIMNHR